MAVLQPRICLNRHGLGFCAFARHYLRNHSCFLFLRVLRCFSSPRLPSLTGIPLAWWVAPFGHPGFMRLFAPRPGFSQLVTSFFASRSHRHPPPALCFLSFCSSTNYELIITNNCLSVICCSLFALELRFFRGYTSLITGKLPVIRNMQPLFCRSTLFLFFPKCQRPLIQLRIFNYELRNVN